MTLHKIRFLLLGCATLLCVACDRREPDQASAASNALFLEVTEEVGLDFQHQTALEERLIPNITGAGGAVFDYDNDGLLDIYLVNGGGDRDKKARWSNRLYRQSPDGRFLDVTAAAGVGDSDFGMGCAVGDIDNDGDIDLFVSNFGRFLFYESTRWIYIAIKKPYLLSLLRKSVLIITKRFFSIPRLRARFKIV